MSTIKELNHLVKLLNEADKTDGRGFTLANSDIYGYKITTLSGSHNWTISDTKKGCAAQARGLLRDIEVSNRHAEQKQALLDRIEFLEMALAAALAAPAAPSRRM